MKIIQVCSHDNKLYAVDVIGDLYVRCSSLDPKSERKIGSGRFEYDKVISWEKVEDIEYKKLIVG